jgi:hypothetical protein
MDLQSICFAFVRLEPNGQERRAVALLGPAPGREVLALYLAKGGQLITNPAHCELRPDFGCFVVT